MTKDSLAPVMERLVAGFDALLNQRDALDALAGQLTGGDRGEAVTLAECHMLDIIGREGPVNGTTLSRATGLTKGGVSKMIARLMGKGLVGDERREGNRKTVFYALTPEGKRIRTRHAELHEQAGRRLFQILSKKYKSNELAFFAEFLEAYHATLKTVTDELTDELVCGE